MVSMEPNYIIGLIWNIIKKVNDSVISHKEIEHKIFWKNFNIWCKILFESWEHGYSEWYFLGHVSDIEEDVYDYKYKILHQKTWTMELCPIYNISGFIH